MTLKDILHWYFGVWRNYAVFSGRVGREEFWSFVLVSLVVFLLSLLLSLGIIYIIAVIIPTIAVAVRRLHDTDRSGWWILLSFIPIVGWIIVGVRLVEKGNAGENRFGLEPKVQEVW